MLNDGIKDLGRIIFPDYYSHGYPWQDGFDKQLSGCSVAQDGVDTIKVFAIYTSQGAMLRDAIRHAEISGVTVPAEAYEKLKVSTINVRKLVSAATEFLHRADSQQWQIHESHLESIRLALQNEGDVVAPVAQLLNRIDTMGWAIHSGHLDRMRLALASCKLPNLGAPHLNHICDNAFDARQRGQPKSNIADILTSYDAYRAYELGWYRDLNKDDFFKLSREQERLGADIAQGHDSQFGDKRIEVITAILDAGPWMLHPDYGVQKKEDIPQLDAVADVDAVVEDVRERGRKYEFQQDKDSVRGAVEESANLLGIELNEAQIVWACDLILNPEEFTMTDDFFDKESTLQCGL